MSRSIGPNQWAAIERLFHDALERNGEERRLFLDASCSDDPAMRAELESLLSVAESDGQRIETLPGLVAAEWLAGGPDGRWIGETIRHYRIVSLVGRGGTGDVYLAEDTILRRPAAVKFLRHAAADSRRTRHFEEEARAASALNHPNIVTVHEIGTVDGQPYIVTEFVDGDTLRQRMARGALAASDAIEVAIQVAGALEAAHGAGLVHRDIKPENIMWRRDGYAKLLDFGLAKLAAGVEEGDRPIASAEGQTRGLQGTVAYMSPEQVRGTRLDHRTDLFSLGIVLHEMLTGRRPFAGETDADVRHAILTDVVSWRALPDGDVPADLNRIVVRALEKDREQRYQTASALLQDLKSVRRALDDRHAMPPPARRGRFITRRIAVAIAASTLSIAVTGAILARTFLFGRLPPSAGAPRFIHVTEDAGAELFPTLSPDGQRCVYASAVGGNFDLYERAVEGGPAVNLTADSPERDTMPAFSPDGKRLAFVSDRDGGGTYVMDIASRHVRRVSNRRGNPTWSPDGASILVADEAIEEPSSRFLPLSQIWRVNLADGAATLVVSSDGVQPRASPHGWRVAYWRRDSSQKDIWTAPLEGGGAPVRVTDDGYVDWNPVWSTDGGQLYFISDRGGTMNVWRVAIDERSGRALSEPEPVTTPAAYAKHVSFSADGQRLAFVQASTSASIRRVSFDPTLARIVGDTRSLIARSTRSTDPSVSPDGQWLAFAAEGDIREGIYVARADGTSIHQLIDDEFKNRGPTWSPDGSRLAFFSNRGGQYDVWTMDRDGRNLQRLTRTPLPNGWNTPIWAHDRRHLWVHGNRTMCALDLLAPDTAGRCIDRVALADSGFTGWSWSADDRRLAGWLNTRNHMSIMSYAVDTDRYEQLTDSGMYPAWLPDGHRIVFNDGGSLYLWDDATRRAQPLLVDGHIDSFRLSPDTRTIYFTSLKSESDVWVLDMSTAAARRR